MARFQSIQIGFVPKTDTPRQKSQNFSMNDDVRSTARFNQVRPFDESQSILSTSNINSSFDSNKTIIQPNTGKSPANASPYLKPAMITLAVLVSAMTLTAIGLSVYAIITTKLTTTTTTTTTSVTTSTSTSTTSTSTSTSTTTTSTTTTLPIECYSYTFINDVTRLTTSGLGSGCDNSFSTLTWVRFAGSGGSQLTTSPPTTYSCGTYYPGWYTGQMPARSMTATGAVCFVYSSYTCMWAKGIYVTNCDTYYVYGLTNVPGCYMRYCTI